MSKTFAIAAKLHKWLALVVAVPILFWFVSGLFFAIAPIERVRSEHMIAHQSPGTITMVEALHGLQRLQEVGVIEAQRVELRSLMGRPVALFSMGEDQRRLYSLQSGALLSPIPAGLAVRIAEFDHAGPQRAAAVTRVVKNSPEYRGALPAWRVDFDDGAGRSLYVAADTGSVAARRSTLWRTFDFLWALHILDFKDHEDFNTPLLIVATALALIVAISGIVMLPSRLGSRSRKAQDG
jgi:hypothetical protein